MKILGENSLKTLISLIRGEIALKQDKIMSTVTSVPTTKQTPIIYNSSDGKYYLWRKDNGI